MYSGNSYRSRCMSQWKGDDSCKPWNQYVRDIISWRLNYKRFGQYRPQYRSDNWRRDQRRKPTLTRVSCNIEEKGSCHKPELTNNNLPTNRIPMDTKAENLIKTANDDKDEKKAMEQVEPIHVQTLTKDNLDTVDVEKKDKLAKDLLNDDQNREEVVDENKDIIDNINNSKTIEQSKQMDQSPRAKRKYHLKERMTALFGFNSSDEDDRDEIVRKKKKLNTAQTGASTSSHVSSSDETSADDDDQQEESAEEQEDTIAETTNRTEEENFDLECTSHVSYIEIINNDNDEMDTDYITENGSKKTGSVVTDRKVEDTETHLEDFIEKGVATSSGITAVEDIDSKGNNLQSFEMVDEDTTPLEYVIGQCDEVSSSMDRAVTKNFNEYTFEKILERESISGAGSDGATSYEETNSSSPFSMCIDISDDDDDGEEIEENNDAATVSLEKKPLITDINEQNTSDLVVHRITTSDIIEISDDEDNGDKFNHLNMKNKKIPAQNNAKQSENEVLFEVTTTFGTTKIEVQCAQKALKAEQLKHFELFYANTAHTLDMQLQQCEPLQIQTTPSLQKIDRVSIVEDGQLHYGKVTKPAGIVQTEFSIIKCNPNVIFKNRVNTDDGRLKSSKTQHYMPTGNLTLYRSDETVDRYSDVQAVSYTTAVNSTRNNNDKNRYQTVTDTINDVVQSMTASSATPTLNHHHHHHRNTAAVVSASSPSFPSVVPNVSTNTSAASVNQLNIPAYNNNNKNNQNHQIRRTTNSKPCSRGCCNGGVLPPPLTPSRMYQIMPTVYRSAGSTVQNLAPTNIVAPFNTPSVKKTTQSNSINNNHNYLQHSTIGDQQRRPPPPTNIVDASTRQTSSATRSGPSAAVAPSPTMNNTDHNDQRLKTEIALMYSILKHYLRLVSSVFHAEAMYNKSLNMSFEHGPAFVNNEKQHFTDFIRTRYENLTSILRDTVEKCNFTIKLELEHINQLLTGIEKFIDNAECPRSTICSILHRIFMIDASYFDSHLSFRHLFGYVRIVSMPNAIATTSAAVAPCVNTVSNNENKNNKQGNGGSLLSITQRNLLKSQINAYNNICMIQRQLLSCGLIHQQKTNIARPSAAIPCNNNNNNNKENFRIILPLTQPYDLPSPMYPGRAINNSSSPKTITKSSLKNNSQTNKKKQQALDGSNNASQLKKLLTKTVTSFNIAPENITSKSHVIWYPPQMPVQKSNSPNNNNNNLDVTNQQQCTSRSSAVETVDRTEQAASVNTNTNKPILQQQYSKNYTIQQKTPSPPPVLSSLLSSANQSVPTQNASSLGIIKLPCTKTQNDNCCLTASKKSVSTTSGLEHHQLPYRLPAIVSSSSSTASSIENNVTTTSSSKLSTETSTVMLDSRAAVADVIASSDTKDNSTNNKKTDLNDRTIILVEEDDGAMMEITTTYKTEMEIQEHDIIEEDSRIKLKFDPQEYHHHHLSRIVDDTTDEDDIFIEEYLPCSSMETIDLNSKDGILDEQCLEMEEEVEQKGQENVERKLVVEEHDMNLGYAVKKETLDKQDEIKVQRLDQDFNQKPQDDTAVDVETGDNNNCTTNYLSPSYSPNYNNVQSAAEEDIVMRNDINSSKYTLEHIPFDISQECTFASAFSPDSGIESPPVFTEKHDIAFINKLCICGKPAKYVCVCSTAMYCNQRCQYNHWPIHRNSCYRYSGGYR